MTETNKLVKDYLGNLIPKNKARKIMDKYYLENESCFLMEDDQWYRITSSDKIVFDHYSKKYVLLESTKLVNGIVDVNGTEGKFRDNEYYVRAGGKEARKKGNYINILNEKIANELGYIECIGDGFFYPSKDISSEDRGSWFEKKNIPQNERSKSYNLEADPGRKRELEELYAQYNPKISVSAKRIAKIIGDYSIGMEAEVINGFLPRRIRSRLGIKALKDGSLRWENGEGIELVSMPMKGPKAIETIREFCKELSKRCEVNNFCSLHFHFGNVRKDKLYTLSAYKTIYMIQNELKKYFPYSRFNSIKPDGKIYCNPLQDLGIDYLSISKSKSDEELRENVFNEFNKIYKWLNNGKGLAEASSQPVLTRKEVIIDGKKMFYDKWYTEVFTTKSVNHSIQGEKWNRPSRYSVFNFLNLYFNNIGTIESRVAEGTTNVTKALIWLIVSASILRYAEDVKKVFETSKLTLREVLEANMSKKYSDYIMAYMNMRNETFFNKNGEYKSYKVVEPAWFKADSEFSFEYENMQIK
jgi:hypothetical protein